jgi:hypothetical protein
LEYWDEEEGKKDRQLEWSKDVQIILNEVISWRRCGSED